MRPKRSLFSLIMFCATSSLVAALGLAVLFASFTVAFAVSRTLGSPEIEVLASAPESPKTDANSPSNQQNFSGVITDERCGPRHDMGSDKTSAQCTEACVRDGISYALVDGDKKYKLSGNTDEMARAAGQRATVSGKLNGDTIQAASISTTE